MKFMATKKVRQRIVPTFFFVAAGSGTTDTDRKQNIRIRDKHPGSTLLIASVKGGRGAPS
jgi:hypothetical protein